VAGEIAPRGRDPGVGAIAKKPKTFQQTANGLSPSVTFTHDPLNNYVAMHLAKGASHPLYVLTVYTYQAPPRVQPLLVAPEAVEESDRLLSAEEAALRTALEAKLRDYVHAIEPVGIAVVPLIRAGSPRDTVVRVAEEIRADCIVIGSHSKRHVFDLGGTAQAICKSAPATVVLASPPQ
jgi:nucleotide-binding universal stress UspA family protein